MNVTQSKKGKEMQTKPLNLTQEELRSVKIAIDELEKAEDYHIRNSTVGKIGKKHLDHILGKVCGLITNEN